MKSPFHHIRNADKVFEHFHRKIHHAFAIFALAIIGMLRGASNILSHTSASWTWGGFLTSDFWDQNPSNANIMYALFGDGTPGSTAYTRLWSSSCVPSSIVNLYSTGFVGGIGAANTIYILNPGTYTLTSPLTIGGDCSAILGKGDVIIKANGNNIVSNTHNKVIIDNIKFDGQGINNTGIDITSSSNITLNNIEAYKCIGTSYSGIALNITNSDSFIYNSKFFNNDFGIKSNITSSSLGTHINNVHVYNNQLGISLEGTGGGGTIRNTINNSQIYNNNSYGLITAFNSVIINNSIFYNNIVGYVVFFGGIILNNTSFYNNTTGMWISSPITVETYGQLKFFGNTSNYDTGPTLGLTPPIGTTRTPGLIDTGSTTINEDRVTNPQNGSGQRLLSGTNWIGMRGIQTFDPNKRPIRYIFGLNIPKQITPVRYNSNTLEEYGNNGSDYITTRYIAEPDSTLSLNNQTLVNQYFGSGSTFTQNWQTNGCSLSAFQVKTLNPATWSTQYTFEDHTIYILTGGQYKSTYAGNNFVFNGNCIALIGNNDTRFTKFGGSSYGVLYANNKRNLIIDNVKVDALYSDTNSTSGPAQAAISFDGATNNSTINNAQAYNAGLYGIYLGLSSHHNTLINSQAFNNGSAGIHLYYASNYNVINNTQTYNNVNYGIWFANGSNRNTMNNFQAYNNTIGVFGDLTTQQNILNRATIYNNSDAGIYFKNASGNALNDVRIYHNAIGIKTLYSSMGNKYYGELKLFDNTTANFDGTSGTDINLSAGTAGIFPYAGTLSTGSTITTCLDATNPTLSGDGTTLLTNGTCTNMGYLSFISPYNTYVNYAFGLNMYKQKIPVRYESGSTQPIQIPSQYDSGKYIAEVFAIRDTTPEGVNLLGSGSTELNTWYTTNVYTAGVLNIAVPVTLSLTGGIASGYLIISGNNVGLTGIVNNGDTIRVSLLTRTGYNQTITGTITIGSLTTGIVVTTRGLSQTPSTGSLAFDNLTSVPLNILTGSTKTIAGIETGVLASISFAPIATSGRLEIYSGSTLVNSGTTGLIVYNGYQVRALAVSSTGYAQTITGYVTIGLGTGVFTIMTKGSDSIPPTTPTVIYPLSGEEVFFVDFEWNVSVDSGSGIEGYEYQIAEDTNFVDIINTGFITTTTGTLGSPNSGFDTRDGKYYWRIKAKDRDGNYSSRSNFGYFNVIDSNNRDFINKNNANLWTYYDSQEITLEGIKPGLTLWAKVIGNGTLYKNGTDKGTGSLVQNGDKVYITMRSSNHYHTAVSSVLSIANRDLEFNISTKTQADSGCTLSEEDKTSVQTIFDSLVANYSGDENKYDEFLYTMQSMLADEIDFTNDCNLQYLEDLITLEIGGVIGTVNTGSHIAPNCKEYPVGYDNVKSAYTSPTFKVVTYFANRDSLARYIDSKNPGDCHINTYGAASWIFTNDNPNKHIASNGKIYTVQSDGQGYTSPDFAVAKHFSTLSALRNYIDANNPPQAIRSHQVDIGFSPQIYTAPNAKEYTIYKTDRGYMSYKLMKVKYFSTLADIQYYIRINNPR